MATEIPASLRPKLNALTSLRFFAALAIFSLHTQYFIHPAVTLGGHFGRNAGFASFSAVSLFFVLSGFILAYSHADIDLSSASLKNFWVGRFSRIYPVYFLGLVAFAPVFLTHRFITAPFMVATAKSLASFLPSIFLVQSWFHPRWAKAWNGPGWTLSVETVFYIAFPLLAVFIRRLSRPYLLLLAGLCWTSTVVFALLVPWLLSGWDYGVALVESNPFFHVPTFAVGIALGIVFLRDSAPVRSGGAFYWATTWTLLGLAIIVLLTAYLDFFPEPLVDNCLFVPAFAMLIYGLASGGPLAKLLSIPSLVLLGEASYSLYILQFPVGYGFRFINEGFALKDYYAGVSSGTLGGWPAYAVLLLAMCGISIVVFKNIEVPMRRYVREWFLKSG